MGSEICHNHGILLPYRFTHRQQRNRMADRTACHNTFAISQSVGIASPFSMPLFTACPVQPRIIPQRIANFAGSLRDHTSIKLCAINQLLFCSVPLPYLLILFYPSPSDNHILQTACVVFMPSLNNTFQFSETLSAFISFFSSRSAVLAITKRLRISEGLHMVNLSDAF